MLFLLIFFCCTEELGTDAPGDDIYSMASDAAKVSLNASDGEEDIYEVADMEDLRKSRGRSDAISQNKSFTQSDDDGVYDRVNSLTRDCAAKTRHASESNDDDIYSHLDEESTQVADQEYNHISVHSDGVSDGMYDSLNGPLKQSANSRAKKTSVGSYEDVDLPNIRRSSERSFTSRPSSMKSDISVGDDTYEDVSMTLTNFQVKPTTARLNTRSADEESLHSPDEDTYEDVSKFPILRKEAPPPPAVRLRHRQPLPEGVELKLDVREPAVKSSVSNNPAPTTPGIPPPAPESSDRKHNQRRNLLKGAKVKHPSQWFSRPKLKLEKRISSNKVSELPSHSTEMPGTFAATEQQRVAPSSPLVNQTGMPKPPTRLANSLEDNVLYKSMQQKFKLANADEL